MRSYEDGLKIEKAIKYLVNQIQKSGDNPKPVILHSIRVAFNLESQSYSTEIVIAALLHDLLEDSGTSFKDIEAQFGNNVAKLVKANSYDKTIKDKRARYMETFDRCIKAGKNALLVKTADILDNCAYYSLVEDKATFDGLVEKVGYFLDLSEKLLKNETIYKNLTEKYIALKSGGFRSN